MDGIYKETFTIMRKNIILTKTFFFYNLTMQLRIINVNKIYLPVF